MYCIQIGIILVPVNGVLYLCIYNRKGLSSLIVHIICGSDFNILNVNTKYQGSVQDSTIWQTFGVRALLWQRFKSGSHASWIFGGIKKTNDGRAMHRVYTNIENSSLQRKGSREDNCCLMYTPQKKIESEIGSF